MWYRINTSQRMLIRPLEYAHTVNMTYDEHEITMLYLIQVTNCNLPWQHVVHGKIALFTPVLYTVYIKFLYKKYTEFCINIPYRKSAYLYQYSCILCTFLHKTCIYKRYSLFLHEKVHDFLEKRVRGALFCAILPLSMYRNRCYNLCENYE